MAKRSRTLTLQEAVQTGADLLSVHGENKEYDRAISELIGDLFGIEDVFLGDRSKTIMRMMRNIKPIE